MKFSLGTSEMTLRAKKDHKGFPWYGEIAIFALIFIASQFAMSILLVAPEMMLIFSNQEIMDALNANDLSRYMELITSMERPAWWMVLQLYLTLIPMGLTLLLGRFVGKRKINTYGFYKKGMFLEYGKGLLIGFAMFSGSVVICVITGAAKLSLSASFSPVMLLVFFVGFMFQGMEEEVMCRGFLLTSFSRRYTVCAGMIVNSVVFAALHLSNPGISPLALVNLVLAGLVFSAYYVKSGNIWGAGAMHTIWNFAQGNIYGIKVSGMNFADSIFAATCDESKTLINGGAFGFEGGLGVTIVEVVSLILILLFMKGTPEVKELSVENTEQSAVAEA